LQRQSAHHGQDGYLTVKTTSGHGLATKQQAQGVPAHQDYLGVNVRQTIDGSVLIQSSRNCWCPLSCADPLVLLTKHCVLFLRCHLILQLLPSFSRQKLKIPSTEGGQPRRQHAPAAAYLLRASACFHLQLSVCCWRAACGCHKEPDNSGGANPTGIHNRGCTSPHKVRR